ncbi:hypothetical protein [Providencia rettgeri]|uniref:hypothetical protein n=1 Tax=Providencia rettgeri TaxID=587 RepID=UPI00235ECBE9|nr:hypothetical protein [Providencia rettgeri]
MDFLKSKEATVILLLTAITYTSAIAFEYGYAWIFKYPAELIYVDSNALLKSLIYIFYYITLVTITFYTPYPKSRSVIKNIISIIFTSALMYILLVLILKQIETLAYILIASMIGISTLITNVIYLKRNKNKSYLIWSFILPFIFVTLFSFIIGLHQASTEENFYNFEIKNEKYAVIRIYNNKLIAKKINFDRNSPYDETAIFNLDELKELVLFKIKK